MKLRALHMLLMMLMLQVPVQYLYRNVMHQNFPVRILKRGQIKGEAFAFAHYRLLKN